MGVHDYLVRDCCIDFYASYREANVDLSGIKIPAKYYRLSGDILRIFSIICRTRSRLIPNIFPSWCILTPASLFRRINNRSRFSRVIFISRLLRGSNIPPLYTSQRPCQVKKKGRQIGLFYRCFLNTHFFGLKNNKPLHRAQMPFTTLCLLRYSSRHRQQMLLYFFFIPSFIT